MAATVIGNISLGYQLLWNRRRQPAAVRLFVDDAGVTVDARHLVAAVLETWPEHAPLLLSIQWPPLLLDLLDLPDVRVAQNLWVEVPQDWLKDPALGERVRQAHVRGLKLVWRGEPGQRPDAAIAPRFHMSMLHLTDEESQRGLAAALQIQSGKSSAPLADSPVLPGQIYQAMASRPLAEHCLDQQGAWALAGWPTQDVLSGYLRRQIQPDQSAITRLVQAIDADASLEAIENILSAEPILAYRFFRHVNSAGLGLRSEVDSIRRGLMVLGFSALKAWLMAQLPLASADPNLQPVRMAVVTRTHLLQHLLDAGSEDDLRREVYLCGLLSQIEPLLGKPLRLALSGLPLPARIQDALLHQSGPYQACLEIAAALESPATRATRALCKLHQISLEDVNRALLRTLAELPIPP